MSELSKPDRRRFLRDSSAAIFSLGAFGSIGSRADVQKRFDYIVVGSGAGGGPLVVNLAKAGKAVLLLEAGDASENNNFRVPAFWGASTEDPTYAWNFYGKQNSKYDRENSNYTADKGVLYPRAATLGGCTAHNAMITMYHENSDWENIA